MPCYFGTVNVYAEDVASLGPGCWLRTNVVAYELARVRDAASSSSSTGGGASLCILDPSVAQCIFAFRSAALGPVQEMTAATRILCPINDYDATEANQGRHWSLLAVDVLRDEGGGGVKVAATHFDSVPRSCNAALARAFYELLRTTLFASPEFAEANGAKAGGVLCGAAVAESKHFPPQNNSYDCGLFLCCGVAALAADDGEGDAQLAERRFAFDATVCAAKRLDLVARLSQP